MDYRKIDVDQYDDDALLESDLVDADPRSPADLLAAARSKATEVRTLLSK